MRKTRFYLIMLMSMRLCAMAQGLFNFSSWPDTGPVVVFDVDAQTLLSGTAFVAQLWVGPTADSLAPVGSPVPFRTGAAAGRWRYEVCAVHSVQPGQWAAVQVRAWRAADGPDFETVVRVRGRHGCSNMIFIQAGGIPDPVTGIPSLPAMLNGLHSFSLVPEPDAVVLACLGLAVLLLNARLGRDGDAVRQECRRGPAADEDRAGPVH